MHGSHSSTMQSNSSWKNRMFEEFAEFELSSLDMTPLLKYLQVDQDRKHLKMFDILIFVMIKCLRCSLKGANMKKSQTDSRIKQKWILQLTKLMWLGLTKRIVDNSDSKPVYFDRLLMSDSDSNEKSELTIVFLI